MNPISRTDAQEVGATHYFTGKPCPQGHVAARFVSTFACVECVASHRKRYRTTEKTQRKEREYKKRYRAENREAISEYGKRYWRENPNARKVNAKSKAKHRDRVREYNSEYWAKNKDRLSANAREWRQENPEYMRAHNANRRAMLKGAGTHTQSEIRDIVARQKNKCAECKASILNGYHMDHIMPLTLGGSNEAHNLQALCPPCNQKKYNKHPVEWAQENGRLL